MKRVILRIAALGTVVVLGLIAIAQAQRGAEDPPPTADRSAETDQPIPDERAPAPISLEATAGAQPLRDAAPVSEGNPLRGTDHRATIIDATPPRQLPLDDRTGAALAERPARRDPFGLSAGHGESATAPADGRIVRTSTEVPEASPPQAKRYPQRPDPMTVGDSSVPPSAMDGTADSAPSTERYPAYRSSVSEVPDASEVAGLSEVSEGSQAQEPAQFGAAPSAEPSSLLAPDATLNTGLGSNLAPLGGEPANAGVPPTGEGTGRPGGKELEGPQSPQLTVQKLAPEQIQVGKPATFRVTVRNTGSIAAGGVEIRDRIPQGTRLISTVPRASRGARGELAWALGTMKPGDESTVEIELEPIAEGEIGSVATVAFNADASARSFATKPELKLKSSAPSQVLIGEEVEIEIEVSNPGSGTATGVTLLEQVPPGLEHPVGTDLEYSIGELAPGESRKMQLTMVASRPGPVANLLTVRGEGNLRAEDRLQLEVLSPKLDVAMEGPKKRYLEREAVYTLSVGNPGTAVAEQVELVAYLPDGLKFVSANNAGHYDEADREVHWRLEQLPVDEVGTVELATMPVEPGQYKIRLRGAADKCSQVEKEQSVLIEGIAAIMFEVVDVTDPVEVGGETMYEIRVVNQGSKAATNVRLAVLLPTEMQAVAAEGPTRNVCNGNQVIFDGLSRLAPKADTSYRVRAKGLHPGDLRVRVQLLTNEMSTPVTKEESTRVYSDE